MVMGLSGRSAPRKLKGGHSLKKTGEWEWEWVCEWVVLSGVRQVDWKAIRLPLPCIKYEATRGHNSICCYMHPRSISEAEILASSSNRNRYPNKNKMPVPSAIWFSSKAHQTHYVAFRPDHLGHIFPHYDLFFSAALLFVYFLTDESPNVERM